MSLIERNNFQILRGGVPGNYEGCHDAVMDLKDGVKVMSGTCISFDANSGKYDVATLTTVKTPFYMVIEGNDDADSYAGGFVNKATGIRGTYRTQVAIEDATGLTVGGYVGITDGKLIASTDNATHAFVGLVISYDEVSKIAVIDIF